MPQSRSKREYGAPIDGTPKPGGTTRKRPKPGDKDPNYKPADKKPTRPPSRKKPDKPAPTYNRRDYRGVDGAVEDAEKGKKK